MSFNTNHHDYSKLLANLSARLERCLKAEPEVDHRHELALISAEAQIINRHLLDQFIASLDNEDSEGTWRSLPAQLFFVRFASSRG